jgi:hypothetical protein
MIVAIRRHTLMPVDACLYALLATIPHPTRSVLHRCAQRHGISRLPDMTGDKALLSEVEGTAKQKFKVFPIRHFHIDIAEVRTKKASYTSVWASTARPNAPSPNSTNRPIAYCGRTLGSATRSRALRLRTPRGLTHYEYVARIWTGDPSRFKPTRTATPRD